MLMSVGIAVSLAAVSGIAISATRDKYTLKVPGGLAFSEFKGYESWEVIAVSYNGDHFATTVGNPEMIKAYKAGFPENGKPFPDGAKMAKVHWNAAKNETYPGQPIMPTSQHDVDFMAKDNKRFPDGHGWGYAEFEYDPASQAFRVGDTNDKPPQGHDAKCGVACRMAAKDRDYVFTKYMSR